MSYAENFEQASEDYHAALKLLSPHLPPYSRRLSDAHLRLGLALEFHPDTKQRELSMEHIRQAANVLRRRLVELERVSQDTDRESERDSLFNMDSDQIARETKDVQEMLTDLETKVRRRLISHCISSRKCRRSLSQHSKRMENR